MKSGNNTSQTQRDPYRLLLRITVILVAVVVVSAAGDDDSTPRTQALGPHGLDCTLCLQLQALPPSLPPVALFRTVPQPVPVPWQARVFKASWHGAPLPARGPPGVTTV